MHLHYTTYTYGDIVYLKTDPEQCERMVIAFTLRPGGVAFYEIGFGADSSFHFDIELSAEPDPSVKLGLSREASK